MDTCVGQKRKRASPAAGAYKRKPWTEAELQQLHQLVEAEGANDWNGKAAKLGTGRSKKSLQSRWQRDEKNKKVSCSKEPFCRNGCLDGNGLFAQGDGN